MKKLFSLIAALRNQSESFSVELFCLRLTIFGCALVAVSMPLIIFIGFSRTYVSPTGEYVIGALFLIGATCITAATIISHKLAEDARDDDD